MGKRRHAGAAPPHPPLPGGAAGSRAAPAGYWLVLDTNVLIDYARHADGDTPDRPLPGEFIRFIGDNPGLVLRVNGLAGPFLGAAASAASRAAFSRWLYGKARDARLYAPL